MKTILCAAGVAVVLAVTAAPGLGKRVQPPTTKICNQTKTKQYVATMHYAGRRLRSTSGWTFIAPAKCHTFRRDRYAIRGSAKVTGLDDENALRGCVKNTKRFDITTAFGETGDKKKCDEQEGYLVDFRLAKPDTRKNTANVVIGP